MLVFQSTSASSSLDGGGWLVSDGTGMRTLAIFVVWHFTSRLTVNWGMGAAHVESAEVNG